MTSKSAKTGKFTKDTDPSTTIKQQATGYIIKYADHQFFTLKTGQIGWTPEAKDATQFARRKDAKLAADLWLSDYEIKKVRS